MGSSEGMKYSYCGVPVCDHVCDLVDNNVSEEIATAVFKLISTTQMKAVGSYNTLEPMFSTRPHDTTPKIIHNLKDIRKSYSCL
jgi:hypothetical protein